MSRARSPSWPAARWWCSSTCSPISIRRWCCATVPPMYPSSSSVCRATRCRTPSSMTWARTSYARRWRWYTAPSVPQPYGGKPRVIMADLDSCCCKRADYPAADVSAALQRQNVILPAGNVKIGDQDYTLAMNNSPDLIESINAFPIKQAAGRTVFMHDVAHVRRISGADHLRIRQWDSRHTDDDSKNGRRIDFAVIDGACGARGHQKGPAADRLHQSAVRPIVVRRKRRSTVLSACMAAALTAPIIMPFLGNVRLSVIIRVAIPLSIITAVLFIDLAGRCKPSTP